MSDPLVVIAITFALGIGCGAVFACPTILLLVAGLISATLVYCFRRTRTGLILLLGVWAVLGALRLAVWKAHPLEHLATRLTDQPQRVRLHGIVWDDPASSTDAHHALRVTCLINLLHRRTDTGWEPIEGRLRATFHQPTTPLAYGDDVLIEGQWSRVPSPGNPGQYDWRAALARQHVHGLLQVPPVQRAVIFRHDQGHSWLAAVFRLRRRWQRLIQDTFEEPDAGLLRSLLLGQRVALNERLNTAFIETGTIHLLVISGFNVGLLALLLEGFLRFLGVSWRLRLFFIAIGLAGYCPLTGLQPPVLRATVMAWVVLGAVALDRIVCWPNTLAAAALVLLWINPTQLFDPSFQLSFGAVASLLVWAARWQAWCERQLQWIPLSWLRRALTTSLSATAAIWVGLSPMLAWYFHLVVPVAVLANLLVAPIMSLLITFGTALLMAGTLCSVVVRWGAGILRLLLRGVVWCVSWCHAIPGGHWYVGHPSLALLAGYYGLLFLTLWRVQLRLTPSRLALCWTAALFVWVGSAVGRHLYESRWLRVDVLDVGHGDSILVRTPRGLTLLVDTGSQEAGRFRVLSFLHYAGLSSMDQLLLTHTDEDHLGGAIPLLQSLRIKHLFTNGVRGSTWSAQQVMSLASERRITQTVLTSGMSLDRDPDVAIDVLHPPPGFVPGEALQSNDNCVVLKLAKGAVSFLLTGDIEEAGLPWLLGAGKVGPVTVLKVPHHGSRLDGAGERLFEETKPRIAILSVGRLHHLPSPETMQLIHASGATFYSTRDDGAVSLRTDGKRLEVRTFKTRRREIFPVAE